MSQHIIEEEDRKWVFGWDNMLQSFYLQLHDLRLPEEANPVVWLGAMADTRMYDVEDLTREASRNGLKIAYALQVKLYGERDDGV